MDAKEKVMVTKDNHKEKTGHNHSHNNVLALVYFGLGLLAFIASYFIHNTIAQFIVLMLSIALSGHHVIAEGILDTIEQSKLNKRFVPNIHILMLLAGVGAILIGETREAALLILIFAGAHFLEDYAESRSNKEITNLLALNPTTARRFKKDGSLEIVDVAELKIGDTLQVLNGDQVPTDGSVQSGSSYVDQSAITGESIPVAKNAGDQVFGSTLNGTGTFVMEVTKDTDDTVFAKIVEMVSQTQSNISKTAAMIKRYEPKYVGLVMILAPVFYLLGLFVFKWGAYESFYRTMVYLIGASPCALAATDIPATLSAISNLARHGVLFKGGSYLSNLADLEAIAFDKTGTLTQGKPVVTDIYFSESVQEDDHNDLLDILVSMEKKANHPLAQAIVNHFKEQKTLALEVENIAGVGIVSMYQQTNYKIAKPTSYKDVSTAIKNQTQTYENAGKTVVYFGTDTTILMLIAIQDIPKETARAALDYFKENDIHTVMITGDAVKTGEAIGRQLGINEVQGNVMPEDKSSIITTLKKSYPIVAMVGDGVNDAPALVASDIGIAMGDGTDIAIDAADVVLMENDLKRIVYMHKVSKRLKRIVWENIIFALAVVVFLTVTNLFTNLVMANAVLVHEGSTLIVILNGLRMLRDVK